MKPSLFSFAVLAAVGVAQAKDFSARVVDGLGNPLAGVSVRLVKTCTRSNGKADKSDLANVTTDADGRVSGSYSTTAKCPSGYSEVVLEKDGYAGFADSQLKPEYVLRRKMKSKDVARVAVLQGESQRLALRDVIVAYDDGNIGKALNELLLTKSSQIHDALLSLATDEHVKRQAIDLIATLASQDDMARILPVPPPPPPAAGGHFENRWIYAVVTGLVEPTTESQWALLERAALGDYDDGWVDTGAIQSLRLNASARSRSILQLVAARNPERKAMAERALAYIDAGAQPVVDADLIAAGTKAAKSIGYSGWQDNGSPRYSENHDIALIDSSYIIGRDLLVNTATFHRVGDQWRLRALRETSQALLAKNPKKE